MSARARSGGGGQHRRYTHKGGLFCVRGGFSAFSVCEGFTLHVFVHFSHTDNVAAPLLCSCRQGGKGFSSCVSCRIEVSPRPCWGSWHSSFRRLHAHTYHTHSMF